MELEIVVNIDNPGYLSIPQYLLKLDQEFDVALPDGTITDGVLREITPIDGGPLVQLVVEIDDCYETLFYVNHAAGEMSLVRTHGSPN